MTLNKDLGIREIQEPQEGLVVGAAFQVRDLFDLVSGELVRVFPIDDIPVRRSE